MSKRHALIQNVLSEAQELDVNIFSVLVYPLRTLLRKEYTSTEKILTSSSCGQRGSTFDNFS